MQPIFIQIDDVRINLNNVTKIINVQDGEIREVRICFNVGLTNTSAKHTFTYESGQAQRFLHAIDYCEQIHTFKG